MIEIRYRDSYEVADMAGQSVAEARNHFKGEFGIPEKATAKLNGQKVSNKVEAEICLNDDDKLTFARNSKGKGLIMAGALLLTMAVTGGVFAFTVTSTSTQLGTIAQNDFVAVTANLTDNVTGNGWGIFGKYKGTLPDGNLFDIIPADGYPGDLVATVSIGNGDEMVSVYRVYVMKIEIEDEDGLTVSSGILTMSNGEIELPIDVSAFNAAGFYVRSNGGFYVSHSWSGLFSPPGSNEEDPLLYIDVAQR